MRLLCIAARDPYQDDRAQELLDALLVAAAFGTTVSLLFQGDGLWQLLPGQQGSLAGRKTLGAQLEALPLYDVDRVYVDATDLARTGLRSDQLLLPVTVLDDQGLQALLREHDQVMRP